jgi:hypothetical protein
MNLTESTVPRYAGRWRHRRLAVPLSLALLAVPLAGCVGDDDADEQRSDVAEGPPPTAPGDVEIVYCDALPDQTDSLNFGGVQAAPVPNGLLTGQALAYAVQWPYFVSVWPRATQESWIIVGVSGGMNELQAELDLNWPGARVLAMNIEWNEQQLASLADQVRVAVSVVDPQVAVDWSMATGRVAVTPSATDDDFWDAISPFAGSPVCVERSSSAS